MQSTDSNQSIPVVIGLGPWSSGSTAITGYLERCGAWTCPPHQMTNDELTPNSHEPRQFRDALCSVFDELTLSRKLPDSEFVKFFEPWIEQERIKARLNGSPIIFLKHPLSAFVIQQIRELCDPEFVVFLRPLKIIENSRLRRRWHPIYGSAGASKIYSVIFTNLIANGISFSAVSYDDFLKDGRRRNNLCTQLKLSPTEEMKKSAEAWLRGAR